MSEGYDPIQPGTMRTNQETPSIIPMTQSLLGDRILENQTPLSRIISNQPDKGHDQQAQPGLQIPILCTARHPKRTILSSYAVAGTEP